jgi:hypothetical protein
VVRFDEKGRFIEPTDKEAWSAAKKWLVFGVLGVLLLSAGSWALGVALSGPHGRGEQIKQINRADNRTFAQEQYHQLLQDIKGYDQQVAVQQAALDAHKAQDAEHDRLAQVVAGLKTQCISTTQQYNAEAQKISKRQFLDAGLPDQIDESDPATDCK